MPIKDTIPADEPFSALHVQLYYPDITAASSSEDQFRVSVNGHDAGAMFLRPEQAARWIEVLTPLASRAVTR